MFDGVFFEKYEPIAAHARGGTTGEHPVSLVV